MAPNLSSLLPLVVLLAATRTTSTGIAAPRTLFQVQEQPLVLGFHHGLLIHGNYSVNLIWYGSFSPSQRSVISDFISSLTPSIPSPSVSSWWQTTRHYDGVSARLVLGRHVVYPSYHFNRSLSHQHILDLASVGPHRNAINVVLTSSDVTVEGFCMSSCGFHSFASAGKHGGSKYAYLWVGNSATQCPGQCAWPFHQPYYGPQEAPLVPPNGDAGVDGMVINLAALLAGTVTNPYEGGYFQGPKEAPMEAASACTGQFGTGAYPGYPGKLLVDVSTGSSYNAVGLYGRKYLLPAMWDPRTRKCATLV